MSARAWQRNAQKRHARAMLMIPALGAALALALIDRCRWSEAVGFGVLGLLSMLGITVGFHRHFAHGAFKARPPVRVALAILGSMSAQGTLAYWVAVHRQHHAAADREGDPHSPRRSFWYAHAGWTIDQPHPKTWELARDLLSDASLRKANRRYPLWVGVGLIAPAIFGAIVHGSALGALCGLLWGGLARIFVVFHLTASVNSICHLTGSRPFATRDQSKNNGWLAIPTLGEAWHNNHHAFPSLARVGFEWWQVDPTAAVIRCLELLGMAYDVKRRRTK